MKIVILKSMGIFGKSRSSRVAFWIVSVGVCVCVCVCVHSLATLLGTPC